MHVAILTGGGDCPGLNAVIRSVTLALAQGGAGRVSGIRQGFLGLLEDRVVTLDPAAVRGLINVGGTLLGSHNKADPFAYFGAAGADCSARAMACLERHQIDVLVAVGGDGTMTIAEKFARLGVPVVGVPKTIDNDLMHNERSFGFDSAVAVVADALGRLETTARSHGRVMVLETMGRHAGWIALEGGVAGGADAIVLPELRCHVDGVAALCEQRRAEQGHAIVCVAEGAQVDGLDAAEPGSVGQRLMQALGRRLGPEADPRFTLLGHLQRGGSPTAFDRALATRFGVQAAELVLQRRFNHMVALQQARCVAVPLADVAGCSRLVPQDDELLLAARRQGLLVGAEQG
ncbi:6-phosphofructokinase [Roseateles sp.]|jgi:6-phosphofructokinase|uniref:6-phosphofructokinase n=1 Tax=Roseateles sp. TaxID=1971397 RepID=UPI0037C51417